MHIKKYVSIMQSEGKTKGEVADRLGISLSILSAIIHGKKPQLAISTASRIKHATAGMVSDVDDFIVEQA